ncbi:MAG: IS200/IS605 family transposase [Thermomicrobiales bacterium]|nr:IS200/IS605 family transposase [Thermomicrobiales bacterium]
MTWWRLHYHLIWTTRDRLPVIDEARSELLMRVLPGLARQDRSLIHGIGLMPEHVHVAISIPPAVAIAKVVNRLKGSSSHLMFDEERDTGNDTWPGWAEGYGVLSFRENELKSVVHYVTHQPEHHAHDRLSEMLENWGGNDTQER